MTVTLTSPVLGKAVGDTYTGQLEDWLLSEGYAKRVGYTGPGVSNTGATDVVPAKDPQLPANREAPHWLDESESKRNATMANDEDNLTQTSFANPDFDFDQGGVDNDPPSADLVLAPVSGPATGGTVVTITADDDNLQGVTAVNFDGVAGTSLVTTEAADGKLVVTTPAGSAGPADVVLVDASGNRTLSAAFTYTA